MHLKVVRNVFTNEATIGDLYIDGKFFCHTLENPDRGLHQNNSLLKIKAYNLFKPTAIPLGIYKVDVNMRASFGKLLPQILNVKGFDPVTLQRGSFVNSLKGLILIGYKQGKNSLFNCNTIESDLIDLLLNEEDITLEITKNDIIYNQFKSTK